MPRDAFNRHHRVLLIRNAASFGPNLLGRLQDECDTGAAGVAIALSALPYADGAVICTQSRERGPQIPVILLVEHGGESEVIHGLNAGANDFMTTPMRHAAERSNPTRVALPF
jgi:DNA-binding response OmpR family regulator